MPVSDSRSPALSAYLLPVLVLASLCLLLPGPRAEAMVWADAPGFEAIAPEAELAGRGAVTKIDVGHLWLRGAEEPYLYTTAWVRIDVPYRGLSTGELLPVRFFGGYDPSTGYWMDIPGLPRLEVGEHVAVFVDNGEHAVFGTFRGEVGMVRFADLGGQAITLDAQWRPRVDGLGAGAGTEDGDGPPYQCVPLAGDRSQCMDWVDSDGQSRGLPLPSGIAGRLIPAEEFDALALRSVAPVSSTEPWPVPLTEDEFRAELEAFVVRINTVSAGQDEEPPTGAVDPGTDTDDTTSTIPADPAEEIDDGPPIA